jgi:hypothetical protein
VHGDIEALALFGEFGDADLGKEVVREAHVHHFGGMAFGGGEFASRMPAGTNTPCFTHSIVLHCV